MTRRCGRLAWALGLLVVLAPTAQAVEQEIHGDPLPPGAIARLGSARLRHAGLSSLVFAPDGKTLFSGGDNVICVWDVTTGKEKHSWPGVDQGWGGALALTPDGKTLAVEGRGNAVHLLDAATGKEIRRFIGVEGTAVRGVALSPDGKFVATTSGGNAVLVWETATGKRVAWLTASGNSLAFASPDTLVMGGSLFDIRTGKELRGFTGKTPADLPDSAALTADGQLLAISTCDFGWPAAAPIKVRLWDAHTGKELRSWAAHKARIGALALSPDGKLLATGSDDKTVRLWDVTSGREIRCFHQAGELVAVAFSPDGKLLAAGGKAPRIALWDVATGKPLHPAAEHNGMIATLAFSTDGKTVVAVSHDRAVCYWDAHTHRPLRRFTIPEYRHKAVGFSRDFRLLAVGTLGEGIQLHDTITGNVLRSFGDRGNVFRDHLAFAPDGKTLATSGSRGGRWTVERWEVATGERSRSGVLPERGNRCVAFSPDGKWLASGEAGRSLAYVWEAATDLGVRELRGNPNAVAPFVGIAEIAFSPDSATLAAASYDRQVYLFNVTTGGLRRELTGHAHWVHAVAFAPNGRTVASASRDRTLRLWETTTGQTRRIFAGGQDAPWAVAYSPDGKTLASGHGDGTILFWDISGRDLAESVKGALTPKQREALWADLSGTDAVRAYRALATLAARPDEAVPLVRQGLLRIAEASQQIDKLIADLDSKQFAVRQRASTALTKMGVLALPALRWALEKNPTEEVRRRAEKILAALPKPQGEILSAEQVTGLRALEVLEHAGTEAARELLQSVAGDATAAWLREEARATLGRLARKR